MLSLTVQKLLNQNRQTSKQTLLNTTLTVQVVMTKRSKPPSPSRGAQLGAQRRHRSRHAIDVQGTVKTQELLRFHNRQQRGIKPRFRFGFAEKPQIRYRFR